ncbi:MAG TPA: hypothetical protein VE956_13255 [Nodularia sp. (in: cyanobacteria)]|nr:hypothetical protein [Nodularia sp. (in: cyanobacteria)]
MSQEADDILRGQQHLNRHLYQQRIADAAEAQSEKASPTTNTGFDTEQGLARLKDGNGNIFYGAAQTNGAVGKGENIRLRRGGVIAGYDAMPSSLQETKAKVAETKPKLNIQILYFVWDAGYFNWYVGGDRKTPLLIKREPDEDTFPPTAPNSDRGIDYTEYELSNISNLDKKKFRAIINTNYQEQFGINPIVKLGHFQYLRNNVTGEYTWVPDDLERTYFPNVFNQGVSYRKLSLVNNKPNSMIGYDLVHQKGYPTVKGFRFLGNGYSFGSINLLRRYYDRAFGAVNYNGAEYGFDEYIELPDVYGCYLSYLEFVESKETDTPASREVIVDVTFSKDKYEYSLPVSSETGAMPTKSPITKYDGNLNTYSYEGEHYLMVGKNSYITEYIKKDSPTEIIREIRFYKNKKFVTNLNTSSAFNVSHDTDNNGGYTQNYTNAIQLQRYKKEDNLTFITYKDFAYLDFCQSLVGKTLTIGSSHYQTNEFWVSECLVNSVSMNQNNAVIFSLTLTKNPFKIGYFSLLCGIGTFAPGTYRNGADGVLYLESGSFFDFAICSPDIAPIPDGRILSNSYLGAYNNTSEFHPFDPDDLAYLHKAILEDEIDYDIYYQDNIYGKNLQGYQYPKKRKIEEHRSWMLYLNNNFTRLHGNKIYRFQVIYRYPLGKVYGGKSETVAESIQHPSTESGYIRNVEGRDARATCYVEVWNIKGSNVTREKRPLKVPVYGLYTADTNWYFSDILDMDIGF